MSGGDRVNGATEVAGADSDRADSDGETGLWVAEQHMPRPRPGMFHLSKEVSRGLPLCEWIVA